MATQTKGKKKKRTHYGKCDAIGFSCFFIFFVHSFYPPPPQKKNTLCKMKKKKHAKLMHENMQQCTKTPRSD